MTEQARAAFRCEPGEHHWVSSSVPSSELVPWVVQCSLCHAYNGAEMDYEIRQRAATPAPAEGGHEFVPDGCDGVDTCGKRARDDAYTRAHGIYVPCGLPAEHPIHQRAGRSLDHGRGGEAHTYERGQWANECKVCGKAWWDNPAHHSPQRAGQREGE